MSKETVTIQAVFQEKPLQIVFTGEDLSNAELLAEVKISGELMNNDYMQFWMEEADAGFPYNEAGNLVDFPPTQILWAFDRMGVTFDWPSEIPKEMPVYIGQEYEIN